MELFKLFGRFAINGANEAERDIDNVTNAAEKSENRMAKAFKKIGAVVATAFAADKIKDFGLSSLQAAADAEATASQFTQVFGNLEEKASASLSKIAENTGIVEQRMKGSYTKIAAFAKTTGMDTAGALSLADRAMIAVADSAAFYDRSLEETTESLQSFLKGNYENDAALGLSATETTRNAAANKLYGKSFVKLSEEQKQLTLLQMVEDANKASGALGQAARESDTWTNQLGNLKQAWTNFKATVGQGFLDIAIGALKNLSNFVTNVAIPAANNLKIKFNELKTAYTENKVVIDTIITALGILAGAILTYNIYVKNAEVITKAIKTAQAAWGVVTGILTGKITLQTIAQKALNKAMMANPIGLIIAAITALIAIFVVAYKKSETFRNAVDALWKTIKNGLKPIIEALKPLLASTINYFKSLWQLISALVIPVLKGIIKVITAMVEAAGPKLQFMADLFSKVFGRIITLTNKVTNVITGIVDAIKKAVNAVKDGINKIKGFFNFKFEWPKLKMPHFSIKPSGWKIGDLLKGSIPKLGIEWYAKGAIFDEPTLFNTPNGIKGVGEAGPEAVAPIDKLTGYVEAAVKRETSGLSVQLDKLIELLAMFFPQILENMGQDIVFNDGVLAGRLAPKMNEQFSNIQRANKRGR